MTVRSELVQTIGDAGIELKLAIEKLRIMDGISGAYPQETFNRGCAMNRARGRLEGLREALALLDGNEVP